MESIGICLRLRRAKKPQGFEKYAVLASETAFTVNEVEALYNFFQSLSSSVIDDGVIQKEEFQLALLNSSNKSNLFADRLFELFDLKHNGVIEFGEFVRALSIFHPRAPLAEKIAFSFRLYDLRQTGYIEPEELRDMVVARLNELDLALPEDTIEAIVDKTIQEADLKGDGKIDSEEWEAFVTRNTSLLKNMTLPFLKELSVAFPSFVIQTKVSDSELIIGGHGRDGL
ncbi:hypothetical protein LIER_17307 [Lithospermum erythrorhizon]|uniref:Calcineurin B-like protein n=1 Tax=Lithospermum erythrorhizon TaxID=34254 RepID=A0AAV3QDY9_LITER